MSDGNFEKHFQFFSSIAEESLKSALMEHFLKESYVQGDQTQAGLQNEVETFLEEMNIVLFWGGEARQRSL